MINSSAVTCRQRGDLADIHHVRQRDDEGLRGGDMFRPVVDTADFRLVIFRSTLTCGNMPVVIQNVWSLPSGKGVL